MFLLIILEEKPIEVIVKLNLSEVTVSPPHSRMLYLFCSFLSDLEILSKFEGEKDFLSPDPAIK